MRALARPKIYSEVPLVFVASENTLRSFTLDPMHRPSRSAGEVPPRPPASDRPDWQQGVVLCLASTSGSLAAPSSTRHEDKHDLRILDQPVAAAV